MISFSQSFDLPTSVKIGEESFALPSPTIRDYKPWLAELTKQWRERETALIPPCTPVERSNHRRRIEMTEATPDDLRPLVFRPDGIERVLTLAFGKIGKADDVGKYLDLMTAEEAKELAVRVSGLFRRADLVTYFGAPKEEGAKGEIPLPLADNAGPTG